MDTYCIRLLGAQLVSEYANWLAGCVWGFLFTIAKFGARLAGLSAIGVGNLILLSFIASGLINAWIIYRLKPLAQQISREKRMQAFSSAHYFE